MVAAKGGLSMKSTKAELFEKCRLLESEIRSLEAQRSGLEIKVGDLRKVVSELRDFKSDAERRLADISKPEHETIAEYFKEQGVKSFSITKCEISMSVEFESANPLPYEAPILSGKIDQRDPYGDQDMEEIDEELLYHSS